MSSERITLSNDPTIGLQMDITAPDYPVEVEIGADGTTLWVNISGVCRFRVCRAPGIKIIDHRT